MKGEDELQTVWPQVDGQTMGQGVWQNTIAAADVALEEASRIQRGVQHNMRLQQEVRALREELRKAHGELDRYRGMHARVVVGMRQLEEDNAGEMSRLRAESEMLMVRHRVYKLLSEHYALTRCASILPRLPSTATGCCSTSCFSDARARRFPGSARRISLSCCCKRSRLSSLRGGARAQDHQRQHAAHHAPESRPHAGQRHA